MSPRTTPARVTCRVTLHLSHEVHRALAELARLCGLPVRRVIARVAEESLTRRVQALLEGEE